MGEQSTSSWAVDPVWTGPVEQNTTRVYTTDMAAIKAEPNSTSDQQTSSPSVDMPPRTRSQTTGSRPAKPSTLATLDEEFGNLVVKDDSSESDPPSSSSGSDYDPAKERREGSNILTTPKNRKVASSVCSQQRIAARGADPNDGRCLLTNRLGAVQLCHVLPRATVRQTLTKLEYVWGIRHLHVDTRYNMLHLRSDWHFLFDQGEWVFVPEADILQKLNKIYVEDKRATSNLTKLFTEKTYKYYVLPIPALQEPICRFPDPNGHDHETHFPPFLDLGPLESHILPHFVIYNAGEKLQDLKVSEFSKMVAALGEMTHNSCDALTMLFNIYTKWTEVQVPDEYTAGKSKKVNPPSEAGRDGSSQGGHPPKRQGPRSTTRSRGQGSQASGGRYTGGQQRALRPFRSADDDDTSSIADDTIVEDDTDWIDYIHNWQKQGDGAAERRGGDVLDDPNDEQLVAYTNEHARTPPSPGSWSIWTSDWDNPKSRYPTPSDRSRFSSNDWALFKNDVYLTRPEYPQIAYSP